MKRIPAIRVKQLGRLQLSAASGIAVEGASIWVVADNLCALHRYSLRGRLEASVALERGTIRPLAKPVKPDLEALLRLPDGRLLALASGSRKNRQRGYLFDAEEGSVEPVDLSDLHAALRDEFEELNIEGGTVLGPSLILAQRGNSPHRENALVRLNLRRVLKDLKKERLTAKALEAVVPVVLGDLKGAPLSLTDLAGDGAGRLCFSAAAELTDDPYRDGGVTGSVIGCVSAAGVLQWQRPLAGPPRKIEGLHRLGRRRWLLVADADDETVPAPLLEIQLG